MASNLSKRLSKLPNGMLQLTFDPGGRLLDSRANLLNVLVVALDRLLDVQHGFLGCGGPLIQRLEPVLKVLVLMLDLLHPGLQGFEALLGLVAVCLKFSAGDLPLTLLRELLLHLLDHFCPKLSGDLVDALGPRCPRQGRRGCRKGGPCLGPWIIPRI